jgi:hypothetical protein
MVSQCLVSIKKDEKIDTVGSQLCNFAATVAVVGQRIVAVICQINCVEEHKGCAQSPAAGEGSNELRARLGLLEWSKPIKLPATTWTWMQKGDEKVD